MDGYLVQQLDDHDVFDQQSDQCADRHVHGGECLLQQQLDNDDVSSAGYHDQRAVGNLY